MSEQDESEKTEEPTEQKLREARKKGDVPKSQEVASLAVLTAGLVVLWGLSGFIIDRLTNDLASYLSHSHVMRVDPNALAQMGAELGLSFLLALAPALVLLMAAAVLGHGLQSGFLVSGEKMKPELSKISPIGGAKRVFGLSALANFGRGIAKLAAVGVAATLAFWPRWDELAALAAAPPLMLMRVALEAATVMMAACLVVIALIAVVDYVAQRMSWMKKQRMSRRDIKDEMKNAEGDPMVKARLRQIRAERGRQRAMAAVPEATVVVANPTHYAVALKYDQDQAPAPICVAKGVDHLALKIREIAQANDVPIVVEAPLARALYASVEVDQIIPETHYQAVAKIIGAILSVAAKRRRRRKAR